MGNCCTSSKKPEIPEPPMEKKPNPEKKPIRYLKFKSKDLNFSTKVEYHSSKHLISYLSNLLQNYPELSIDSIKITKKNQEILDYNHSLHELDILPSDVLYIDSCPVKKTHSPSISVSNEEIAEEESTTKLQIATIQAKLNIGKMKTESTGEAASLWRSAMPSPKNQPKIYAKDPDTSSLINPSELLIENKLPLHFVPYDVKNGQSVLMDSDESYFKSDLKGRDSMHRHPNDFFKDLQGPFSVLKQF